MSIDIIYTQKGTYSEREGFEPSKRCRLHAFQACAFDHSAIFPILCGRPRTAVAGLGHLSKIYMVELLSLDSTILLYSIHVLYIFVNT